jgi:hypothetical protein
MKVNRDNQGRNLEATRRHFDMLAKMHEEGVKISEREFSEKVKKFPLPDWTKVEGVVVLRAGSSRYVAVPKTGKKTAANFEIIDLQDRRDLIAILKKDEVYSWLWRASQSDSDTRSK